MFMSTIFSCKTLNISKMSDKDDSNSKNDLRASQNWKEVYDLISVIENMRIYNKDLVDKYVKDINKKIEFLLKQKEKIELNNNFQKPLKILVKIDIDRINLNALKVSNQEAKNFQSSEIIRAPKFLDCNTSNLKLEAKRPSFYYEHNENSYDSLLSITEDIINSFCDTNLPFLVGNETKSEFHNYERTKKETQNLSFEDSEMTLIFENEGKNHSSQKFHEQEIRRQLQNPNYNLEYKIFEPITVASNSEKNSKSHCYETIDSAFEMTDASDSCCSQSFSKNSSIGKSSLTLSESSISSNFQYSSSEEISMNMTLGETRDVSLKRSKISTEYPFPVNGLRRSKRIRLSVAKKCVSEKFSPLQELRRIQSTIFEVIIT